MEGKLQQIKTVKAGRMLNPPGLFLFLHRTLRYFPPTTMSSLTSFVKRADP